MRPLRRISAIQADALSTYWAALKVSEGEENRSGDGNPFFVPWREAVPSPQGALYRSAWSQQNNFPRKTLSKFHCQGRFTGSRSPATTIRGIFSAVSSCFKVGAVLWLSAASICISSEPPFRRILKAVFHLRHILLQKLSVFCHTLPNCFSRSRRFIRMETGRPWGQYRISGERRSRSANWASSIGELSSPAFTAARQAILW